MNFVVLSEDGSGLPVALRLQDEGYDVHYSVDAKGDNGKEVMKAGDGLLKHKVKWSVLTNNLVKKAGKLSAKIIIVFDANHHPELADKLRQLKYMVIGSGGFLRRLEKDRKFRLQTAKQCRVDMPESYEFKDVDKGIKFLKSQPKKKPFVFKPGNSESHLTYNPVDNADLIEYLECCKSKYKKPFVLQHKIKGIEINVQGWFNGKEFIFFGGALERKRRANESAGSIVWQLKPSCRLVKEGIKKAEAILQEQGIPCIVNFGSIANDRKLFVLEWTNFFNCNISFGLFDLLDERLGYLLSGLASGELLATKLKQPFGASLRLSRDTVIPCVPIRLPKMIHIWLNDAVKEKTGLETAGSNKDIGIITGQGRDIKEALKNLYHQVMDVKSPDINYYVDISQRGLDDYNNLENSGWL